MISEFDIQQYITSLLPTIIKSLFIFLGGWIINNVVLERVINTVLYKFSNEGSSTVSERKKRVKTLGDILKSTSRVLIWGIVFITLFSEWGVNVTPIITGAGIIGLAVGFGAQTLVKDIISGFFLLFENQFNKGDTIEIAGVKGKVSKITLRTTALRDDEGNTHIIPNSQIKKVTKLSSHPNPTGSDRVDR